MSSAAHLLLARPVLPDTGPPGHPHAASTPKCLSGECLAGELFPRAGHETAIPDGHAFRTHTLAPPGTEPPTGAAVPPGSETRLDLSRLLGPAAWASLPVSLRRRFAADHGAARYQGTLALECSAIGAVFAWLTKPLRAPLPAARAAHVAVTVAVSTKANGVVWERRLGARHTVRSTKSPGPEGTVLERTDGGLGMVLDVTARGGALIFTSRAFFLTIGRWRLPVPALLTPGRCEVVHETIDAARFRFTLTMTHPLWGTTFRQTGVFHDSAEPAS